MKCVETKYNEVSKRKVKSKVGISVCFLVEKKKYKKEVNLVRSEQVNTKNKKSYFSFFLFSSFQFFRYPPSHATEKSSLPFIHTSNYAVVRKNV